MLNRSPIDFTGNSSTQSSDRTTRRRSIMSMRAVRFEAEVIASMCPDGTTLERRADPVPPTAGEEK